ncbi:MAG: hypothetical protein U0401_27310 [Anaerolineae bacterium]
MAAAKLARAGSVYRAAAGGLPHRSGRARQRLEPGRANCCTIACTALANLRLLTLDEATSSVDTRTERLIQPPWTSYCTVAPAL